MQPVRRTHHEPMPRGCAVKFVSISRTFFLLADVFYPDDDNVNVPNAQEVVKFVAATPEVAKFVAATQEVPKLVPDAEEVAKLIAAALEVAEVVPAAPEVNEVIPAVQEVTQTDVLIIKALATNPSDEGGLWIQVLILVPLSILPSQHQQMNELIQILIVKLYSKFSYLLKYL